MTTQVQSHKEPSKKGKHPLFSSQGNGGNKNQTHLFEIALEMKKAGLPELFIIETIRAALDFEGVADLMKLWEEENDKQEKEAIIADIKDMIDACNQKDKREEIYVKFNDLASIASNIRAFKDSLLEVVQERGGISYLSELTGIPQSSLSRFFSSNAMPHRSTLLKIAKALELDKIKIELLWTK